MASPGKSLICLLRSSSNTFSSSSTLFFPPSPPAPFLPLLFLTFFLYFGCIERIRRSTEVRNESGKSAPTCAHWALNSAGVAHCEWRWMRNSDSVWSARPCGRRGVSGGRGEGMGADSQCG